MSFIENIYILVKNIKFLIVRIKLNYMKQRDLKYSCLIAVLYFGMNVNAQTTPKDTVPKEQKIEEVVMIGYGSAKKVDLTSAISTVKASEIVKTPAGQAAQSLQGKVAGVQISSFGSPGEAPKVTIRGIKSLQGDNQPLYVVDGLFVDNIDFLNSNDIQDFTVLKDASASAIYGVRASNGVIVITTKGGSYNKKAKLTYDTYYGVQKASNVLKMANAEQFVNFALESGSASEIASVNQAIQRFGRSRINPNLPDVNTDWYKETLRLANIQNHSLSVDGGSDKVAYSLGGSFFTQDGILKMKNSYERFNIRAKIDAKANNWLTVGGVINYSRSEKYDDESSAWSQIYYAVPILPVYDYSYANAYPAPYASAKDLGYRDHQNPFATLDNADRLGVRKRITFNAYAEATLVPKELMFKSALSYNNQNDDERIMTLPYRVSDSFQRKLTESSIERNSISYENYIWDNTLTWNKSFGKHGITAMAGTSYADDSYRRLRTKGYFYDGSPFNRFDESTWYMNNTNPDSREVYDSDKSDVTLQPYRFYRTSYFGRISYKFDDKYIVYGTIRNEGSNKFPNQKKINLPAFGASWVVSKESFMSNISWIDLLKFRGGWGRLANDAVNANRASTPTATTGIFNDQLYAGYFFSTFKDNVKREFTEETNIGLSSEFLKRRLTLEADYFIKDTKNLVIPVLPIVGTEVSYANVGSLRNKGFEIALGWKDRIGENWGYNINGNFSHIKNQITDLYGQAFINRGEPEFQQRLSVGQPIDAFYGWQITGVYQNAAEIAADPTTIGQNIKPGYFKFKDINGDGKIDSDDRTYLGSPVPTYYFGANFAVNYKNWDLSVAIYGQGGNKILARNRGEVIKTPGRNIDAEIAINRWHGEGTTNEFPSSEGYRQLWNQKMSDFWLEDGDFVRIQNIQLGYTLKMEKLPEMRFTFTADRPFLWSKSKNLMNPEVGSNGVDTTTYPTPSVFTFGYSIKF